MEQEIIITIRDNPQEKNLDKLEKELKKLLLDYGLITTIEIKNLP